MLGMEVMGGMEALLAAAKDQNIAFHEERTARLRYNYSQSRDSGFRDSGNDQEGYDWTACDKDCGWCGRCEY